MQRYLSIKSRARVGPITLKNRIGFGPVNLGSAGMSADLEKHVVAFYDALSRGGVALAYIGGVAVSPGGRSNRTSMTISEKSTLDFISQIVENGRSAQTATVVQLMHSGRQASAAETGHRTIAPSALTCPYYGERPAAATSRDIGGLISEFLSAAKLSASTGCEIIEVHAAHGYLLSSFLSRTTNKRRDRYGGSLSNRFRILREIISGIRCELGDSTGLGVRINVHEKGGGISPAEIVEGLSGLDSLDYVSVSGGMYSIDGNDLIIPARSKGAAIWRDYSGLIRGQLDIPVFIAGNIETVALADELIETGQADVALMARSLLADPELYTKTLSGRMDAISPCTELYLCKYHSRGASHVYCPQNVHMRKWPRVNVDPRLARRKSSDRP